MLKKYIWANDSPSPNPCSGLRSIFINALPIEWILSCPINHMAQWQVLSNCCAHKSSNGSTRLLSFQGLSFYDVGVYVFAGRLGALAERYESIIYPCEHKFWFWIFWILISAFWIMCTFSYYLIAPGCQCLQPCCSVMDAKRIVQQEGSEILQHEDTIEFIASSYFNWHTTVSKLHVSGLAKGKTGIPHTEVGLMFCTCLSSILRYVNIGQPQRSKEELVAVLRSRLVPVPVLAGSKSKKEN